jgi:Phage P22-like portal protein
MPRKSKDAKLADIHALALEQFQESYDATHEDRERALLARRFVNVRGAQWDEAGDFDNKMKLEIDHVSGAVVRIKNEYRKNRIEAKFLPSDGSDADALADACAARFRADTHDARGREARDMAFDSAVEGGYGGLRLRAEYESGDYQRICLEPINDAESTLFFDVNAKLKDKSDAEHAHHITPWSRRAFVAKWGEECASWPQHLAGKFSYSWFGTGTDLVYVAEYFVKNKRTDTYRVFAGYNDETQEFLADEIDDEDLEVLDATGFTEIAPRTEEVDEVRKYIMNGAKILSDDGVIPGRCIPLIPQYGHRTVIGHVERFRGHVLKAMDPQIVYNLQVSKVAETAAASSIEKPIFTPEQIAGHDATWQNDNRDNSAFLMLNAMTDLAGNPVPMGPIAFTKSPDVSPAVAALVQLTKQDIADQLGNPENGEMLEPDTSGIALDMIQGRIDMQSYGYMDNAADAERRTAEIWQGMAAEIYVEDGRKLKTMSEDMKRGTVEIGKQIFDAKTGQLRSEIDFSRAAFDVEVAIGPTSASRRNGIVRTLSTMMGVTVDPEMQVMLGHVALMNMEGEGLEDVRDFSRKKLLAMGVIKPTKEEEAEMEAAKQPQAPSPSDVLAGKLAEESAAKAGKAVADTHLSMAKTEETKAKTAETLAGIPLAQQDSALKTAQAIAGSLDAGPTNAE